MTTVWSSGGDVLTVLLAVGLAAFVGGWLLVVLRRALHEPHPARGRFARGLGCAILLAALAFDASMLVVTLLGYLAAFPLAAFVAPLGIWFGLMTWQAMNSSPRVTLRAAADVALSLLIGANIAFALVCALNYLNIPASGVERARGTLEGIAKWTDVPWWLWAALYALLSIVSLAAGLRRERFEKAVEWAKGARVLPSLDFGRRLLSGVHIGLLVLTLVGAVGPGVVGTTVAAELRHQYGIALGERLDQRAQILAYDVIRQAFSRDAVSSPHIRAIASAMRLIDEVARTSSSQGSPLAADPGTQLADMVGQIQGETVVSNGSAQRPSVDQLAANDPAFDRPIGDVADVDARIGDTEAQERAAGLEPVQQAAELASVAVASVLAVQLPVGGDILAIVQAYVSGIVENSRIKDVFFDEAKRRWFEQSSAPLPTGDELVTPDPARLNEKARQWASDQQRSLDYRDPDLARAENAWASDPSLEAAVEFANAARLLGDGAAPCSSCSPPVVPRSAPIKPPRRRVPPPAHPVRPVPEPPIEPRPVRPIEPPPPRPVRPPE